MSDAAILMAIFGTVVLIATVIVFYKVDLPRVRREQNAFMAPPSPASREHLAEWRRERAER